MSPPSNTELSSWKEIAAQLGVSVKTAQLWERDRGLPVRRLPGGRGRVWTDIAELDSWKRSSSIKFSACPETSLIRGNRDLWRLGGVILALMATVLLAAWALHEPDPSLVAADVQGLRAFNARGSELWRYTSPSALIVERYAEPEQRGLSWLGDLNADGSPEVLFSPQTHNFGERVLLCLDHRGREQWRFSPGRTVRTMSGEEFPPPYGVSSVLVLPPGPDGHRRILVVSIHSVYFPAQIALLDDRGRLLREYWHSGHLHRAVLHQFRGRTIALLAGISNATHEGTLIALDPETMGGASKEQDDRFQLGEGPAGQEVVRHLFPRTCISRAFDAMNQAWHIFATNDDVIVSVREQDVPLNHPEILYHFTKELAFRNAGPSSLFASLHERLRRNGTLDHPLSGAELASFRPHPSAR